jgi:hypothetical protein
VSDNPIVEAKDDVEKKVKGVGPYIRAHWKELLALVLAAIPALFIVFHKGAQQAAMQAAQPILDAIPGGAGSPGTPAGPSGGGDPGTGIPAPPAAAPPPSVAPSSSLGISVNGSNPIVGNAPAKTQVQPAASTAPATSSSIVARLGANAPGFRDPAQQVATTAPASKVVGGSVLSGIVAPIAGGAALLRSVGAAAVRRPPAPPPPKPPSFAPGTSIPAQIQSNPVSPYGRGL